MSQKAKTFILYTTLIILGIYFFIAGIIKAQSFLIPFTIAILLSMVMMPVDTKLREWHIPKAISIILSDLIILAILAGLLFTLGFQINSISDNWPEYQEKLKPKIESFQNFIENKTGIAPENQVNKIKKYMQSESGSMKSVVVKVVPMGFSLIGNFFLVFIYIFFFMFYRHKFKEAILGFLPKDSREKGSKTLDKFGEVSQQYLFGRLLLILFLAIIYAIGLSIVGVKYSILISIIAAALSLIPYLGNLTGIVLAILMNTITGGEGGALSGIIGILIVFAIAQFFESYILQPYLVGKKVNLDPVLTLLSVIVGGAIWGIAGMVVAIPLLAILKVICDNVPVLHPLGNMLGEPESAEDDNSFEKWKEKFKKVLNRIKK